MLLNQYKLKKITLSINLNNTLGGFKIKILCIFIKALHLVKALSVLLNFSNDEEKVLKETLEWKMSWFGTRPKIQ